MLWLRSVTIIEVISIVFLFYSNQWRIWCTVVSKGEPVHDLLRVDETITDSSVGVHISVMLIRVSHHDDGRIFMKSCLSIIEDGRHSYRGTFKVGTSIRRMRLLGIFSSSHVPCLSHGLPISHPFHHWTTYLDDIRRDFPYAINIYTKNLV